MCGRWYRRVGGLLNSLRSVLVDEYEYSDISKSVAKVSAKD